MKASKQGDMFDMERQARARKAQAQGYKTAERLLLLLKACPTYNALHFPSIV